MMRCLAALFCVVPVLLLSAAEATPRPIKVLFLGDEGHHRPVERFRQLQPVLAARGIELTYTDKVEALQPRNLASYDALLVYANTTRISPEQEQALLDFVEGGKGFIPLHCASYCFLNSPRYVALVGAQFQRHGTGVVRTTFAEPRHPITQGLSGFESWDETYVHTRHNPEGRTVLEYRAEGDAKEPWTWVRTQGKGRVFYTAWGHDQRTWSNPGFHTLVERGIRWATRAPLAPAQGAVATEHGFPLPEMTPRRPDLKPFAYQDVGKKIPNYRQKGGQGEPLSQMQLPLPPEESMQHLVVPRGFRVELVASENLFGGGKPICINWDERGRLWVALTYDYPNELRPEGEGRDRIVVLDDTDGDGKADTCTTFADTLSIPTSLTFARGGVVVFDGTQTLFFEDTDGDDRADRRKVLFGEWSQRDTHGGPSNLQYGLDNWLWAMQGYNLSRLSVGGETHQFRQGFLRFKPDASKLEFLRSTDNNTWGLGMSEEGLIFGSTANRNPSVFLPIPNRYYEAVRGWTPSLVLHTIADTHFFKAATDKVRQVDHHGGYTAAAGHALYTARRYPREYWNRTAFVNDPTGHLVGTFVLRREGSHFRSSNPFNLLASDDEWTAPIMAEVGPDGNVWVIDWYNYIVQHNPTPQGFQTGKGAAYETDLRDKKYGRIYRVVYDSDPGKPQANRPASRFSLHGAAPRDLVAALRNDNLFWRRHAQRLLVERGQRDVVPALLDLVRDPGVDVIGLNVGAIHGLWALHGLGVLDGTHAEAAAAARGALRHASAGVRRNAVQVLPRQADSVTALLEAGLLRDADPQVRLMALLALADLPPSRAAAEAILAALEDSTNAADRWIPDAATCAAARSAEPFLAVLATRKQPTPKVLEVATIVAEHHARGGPVQEIRPLITLLVGADPLVADAVVRGLAKGWPANQAPAMDSSLEQTLEQLLQRLPAERRGLLVRLAVSWGSKKFAQHAVEAARLLLAQVKDESQPGATRVAAARELVSFRIGEPEAARDLLDVLTVRTPPDVAAGILQAVQASEVASAGRLILERLASFTPATRSAAFSVLLSRPEWTRALLASAAQDRVRLTELALDQKQALAEHPDRDLRRRAQELLKRGGALPNPDRQKVVEELLEITKVKGDPVAGKAAFKNQCAKCHVHGGEGERIGPDLTGMAVHPKEELLTHIIDPSRSVEGNFRLYTVTTKNGLVLQGMLAAESRTAIELFDAEGKKKSILREEVEELIASPKSLMPDGFEKLLSRQDLTNLLEFLTQRGKYLPLPLDRVATAVSTRGMFYREESPVERLVFDDWKPRTFAGVPFVLVDPQGDRVRNVVLLRAPQGLLPPKMPASVSLVCNTSAKAIHLLSGVSGWGYPYSERNSVSLIVRLHYDDGQTEDHPLRNGEHFADYIRRVDVPGSQFAFDLHGRQVRYLAIHPRRPARIERIELVKGPDATAPVVMAATVETAD